MPPLLRQPTIAVATRWSVPVAVTEAKPWAWEELGEAMENDFWVALKTFWTKIRCLRKGKQCTVNTVYIRLLMRTQGPRTRGWAFISLGLKLPRAPGIEKNPSEFLKAMDVLVLSWLTQLCNIGWTSGAVLLYCQTGVMVRLLKKEDRRVCYNFRHSIRPWKNLIAKSQIVPLSQ